MPRKVFLSYAHQDREFAGRLAKSLDSEGVSGFLDSVDVTAGASWNNQLREALRDAKALIVIVSDAAIRSNNVISEVGVAWATDKPIISVVPPNGTVPSELPFPLNRSELFRADGLSDDEIAASVHERLAA